MINPCTAVIYYNKCFYPFIVSPFNSGTDTSGSESFCVLSSSAWRIHNCQMKVLINFFSKENMSRDEMPQYQD